MSALQDLIERQGRGEKLTSLEFAVYWCSDSVASFNAAAELSALQNKEAEKENAALRAEVEALKWVVKRLEFIQENDDEFSNCPICRGEMPTHYEDCELAAALNAPSEGQKRE